VYQFTIRLVVIITIITSPNTFSHSDNPHNIPEGKSKADSLEQCVEPTDVMRKKHFNFLYHQRDKTVIKGIRTKKHSLANCVDCHVAHNQQGEPIPVNSEGQFCQVCHIKTATNIDCFSCHATVPRDRMSKNILKDNLNKASDLQNKTDKLLYYYQITLNEK